MARAAAFFILFATIFALSACSDLREGFQRPGAWHEGRNGGSVMYDLRAEVANPADLMHGRGIVGPEPYGGKIASQAESKIGKKLSNSSSSGLISGSGGTGSQGSGSSTGG